MAAQFTVPVLGTRAQRIQQAASTQAISVAVAPRRIAIERNDHNHADACEVTLDWTDATLDPRMLDNGVVSAFIDDANDSGFWEPRHFNCRFIGLVKDTDRDAPAVDEPLVVTVSAIDYTDLFLKAKPFGSKGIPHLSQSLQEAWETVISQTPGAEALAKQIEFQDVSPGVQVGSAVSERFRKLARVPAKPGTDAWAVWQQCVGMLGLISYFELDTCIVTTATNLYTELDPPVLTWGDTLVSLKESRQEKLARKAVGITSFDSESGATLEAFYPPIADSRVKRKRARAKKILSDEAMRQGEERDWFSYPGISDQQVLDALAQRVYEERGRQELQGRGRTAEMRVPTVSGASFDLLNLKAGDSVRIQFAENERQTLLRLPTDGARVRYLVNRGADEATAQLLAANIREFAQLESTFLVRSVRIEFEIDDDSGSFWIDVEFINRIQVDGASA
ncbi:MAG: hypothetical protein R3B13_33710 [Polyangiaceae bacterium]